jgi:hypothetical protein
MSRQQRRKAERELLKLAGDVRRDGLPFPHRPEATMALALAVRDALRNGTSPVRATQTAVLVHGVYAASLRRMPPAPGAQVPACKAGCAYCCHHVVMAPAPEIFRVAAELRAGNDTGRLGSIAGRCDAVAPARAAGARPPCPLLEAERCSVYAARPAVCRKHTSFAVAACRAEFDGRPADIPVRRFDQLVFECCAVALITGMRLWDGRACAVLELSAALAVALRDPDAEPRWLAGEDVFAAVPSQARLPGIAEHAAFIWDKFAGDAA